jgi:dTDP-4-dehydrorhamnose 3,5-epimerase
MFAHARVSQQAVFVHAHKVRAIVAVDRMTLRGHARRNFELAQIGSEDAGLLAVGIQAGCLDRGDPISSPVAKFCARQLAGDRGPDDFLSTRRAPHIMNFVDEPLSGAYRVRLNRLPDNRGNLVKTYMRSVFAAAGMCFEFCEEYYSVSKKDVIRGMHFQIPPYDHDKLVYCPVGAVEDVLLDLRSGPGYGKFCSILLSDDRPELIIVPKGVAHGFRSLKDLSVIVSKASTEYAPQHDMGVRWDSFGFDWRCESPILSDRDRLHQGFSDFKSPF